MGRRSLLLVISILVAAAGTALIGLYVRGADTRAAKTAATVRVLVADADVPAGTSVKEATETSKIGTGEVSGTLAKGALQAFPSEASQFASNISAGSILRPSMLVTERRRTGTTS